MWDDGQMSATKRDEVWMYVAPMANFSRSVEKLNLNQIKRFKVYKRENIFLSSIM